MAYSTECLAHIPGLLLPKPSGHVQQCYLESYGGPVGLSVG